MPEDYGEQVDRLALVRAMVIASFPADAPFAGEGECRCLTCRTLRRCERRLDHAIRLYQEEIERSEATA